MQRNGSNRVEMAFAEPVVIQCRRQPARNQMPKKNLAAVFSIKNDVTNDPARAIAGDGRFDAKARDARSSRRQLLW
jgi:hypothetical protein